MLVTRWFLWLFSIIVLLCFLHFFICNYLCQCEPFLVDCFENMRCEFVPAWLDSSCDSTGMSAWWQVLESLCSAEGNDEERHEERQQALMELLHADGLTHFNEDRLLALTHHAKLWAARARLAPATSTRLLKKKKKIINIFRINIFSQNFLNHNFLNHNFQNKKYVHF